MDSVKNVLAAIGIVAIISVAGLALWMSESSNHANDDADAASSSDIIANLTRYAEILNDDSITARVCVNDNIFLVSGTTSSISAEPVKGTVKVSGLSLEFDKWYDDRHTQAHHYIVPYHAISGIRITSGTV
ncbi:MAG: hypothetical protein E7Z68_02275 [Thermoplasmata archaeon]|jgi:hypothetical protein|nr:hypothetical protein [Thermoplasmata archaeon]